MEQTCRGYIIYNKELEAGLSEDSNGTYWGYDFACFNIYGTKENAEGAIEEAMADVMKAIAKSVQWKDSSLKEALEEELEELRAAKILKAKQIVTLEIEE